MNNQGILFMATNGAGLGHLTRSLAIARRIKKKFPEEDVIMLSTSPAMHLVKQEGILGYHLPSIDLYNGKIRSSQWNEQLSIHLKLILNQHNPQMIVFDGAFPYTGILSGVKNRSIKKIWVRREINQRHPNFEKLKEKEQHFNYIIIPSELGDDPIKENSGKYFHSHPVIFLDRKELLSRQQVRQMFHIPKNDKVIYIQLGAGAINDIQTPVNFIIDTLKKLDHVFIILGESPIGDRFNVLGKNITTLRDYPNSRFFNGVDLAISASGYNSTAELMYFGVPTLFLPNSNTKADDQMKRAQNAVQFGSAHLLDQLTEASLIKSVKHLLNQTKERDALLNIRNGADEIADFLVNLKN